MIPRIHALVDAFANLNGAFDPQSKAYKLRNPIMLRAFHPKHACTGSSEPHKHTEDCYRIFKSFTSGYDNAILDARIKCSGNSFSKLTPENTLRDLVRVYGNPPTAAKPIKNFLRIALDDDSISETTPLSYFLEDTNVKE